MSERTWQVISGVLALVVIALLINGFGKTAEVTQQPTQAQQPAANVDMTVLADDVVKGSSDAKITIIVYSDPSCPYCGASAGGNQEVMDYLKQNSPGWTPAEPGIMKDFVDTGKARIIFRYFPGHGKGVDAMKIMLCANEQGKFWETHEVMFANQNLMEAGDTAGLKKAALTAGLDSAKLDSCLANNNYDAKMQKDTQLGQASGVSGTPAFAINGELIQGAQPYSAFKQALDALLKA